MDCNKVPPGEAVGDGHSHTVVHDRRALRDAFGHFATGVCIIGAATDEGEMLGATVNSFTSLSLDPPLVLVCVGHFMRSHDSLIKARGFAVSLLSRDQEDLSNRFAKAGTEKWLGVDAKHGEEGGLIVNPHLAYFDCVTHDTYVSGDHTILIGRILKFSAVADAKPLIYFRGAYDGVHSQVRPEFAMQK